MQPVDYNHKYQPDHISDTSSAVAHYDDEMLSPAESFLLLAALCTLAASIFSFSLI